MNIFIETILLFVYVFMMLQYKILDIESDNLIFHKLHIFVSVGLFYFVIQLIKKILNKCVIDVHQLLNQSIITSIICILGYSIYIDLTLMKSTKSYINSENLNKNLTVAITMIGFYMLVQLSFAMFQTRKDICE